MTDNRDFVQAIKDVHDAATSGDRSRVNPGFKAGKKHVALQDAELWPEEVVCYTAWTGTNQPYQERVYVPYEHLLKLESRVSDTRKSNYKLRRRIHNQKCELSRLYKEVARLRERTGGGCVMEHDDIRACWHEDNIHVACPELPEKVVVTLPDPRGREVYTAQAYEYVRKVDAYIEFRREGGEGLAEELNAELELSEDGCLGLPVERLERYALMARQQEKLISGLRAMCSYAYYGFVVEHGDADERTEFADRLGELGVKVKHKREEVKDVADNES